MKPDLYNLASACAKVVQHIDNSRLDEHPVMDNTDYDHAEEVYDQIATIINDSGCALYGKAYIVALLGLHVFAEPEKDIPLSEAF
jgi:hypothetical protein